MNLYDNHIDGTVISLFDFVKKVGVNNSLRNMRRIGRKISDGGWHFTSLGGEDRVLYKLSSFSHTELDYFKKGEFNKIKNLWNSTTKVPIDDSYPKTILDNIKFYRELGFIVD